MKDVTDIQQKLLALNYDPHGVDGTMGRQSWAAVFSCVARAQLGDVGLALADGFMAGPIGQYNVTLGLRATNFIGQALAETGGARNFVENLNYSAAGLLKTFPTHYTLPLAMQHARDPETIGNHVYANRMGNGDEGSGDGWRFRGRGPTMLTGLANYESVGKALGIELVHEPDRAADPTVGMLIMGSYWNHLGLNAYADRNDTLAVSRGINLGSPRSTVTPNGMLDRNIYTNRAKALLV
jgi:putative chitinase